MEADLSAEEVKKAIKVAADICVFTNENVKLKNIMDNSNVTQLHPKDKNQKEEASLVSSCHREK